MDMTSIGINNIPVTQREEVGYRTISNSTQMNKQNDDILSDILDLFNKANQMEKNIADSRSVIGTENTYLQYRINDLETKIATLSQRYKDITAADPNATRTIIRYPNEMTTDGGSDEAFIDLENMDITLQHAASLSKVNLYDDALKTTFVPPSLKLETGPDTLVVGGSIRSIEDSDLTNAFDGDHNTYWVRKVVTDNTVNEITTQLTIGLPEDIITSREINTVIVNPYPVNAVDIISIEYKESGNWIPLDAFATHRCSIIEEYADIFGTTFHRPIIENCPNIKLSFRSINVNQVRITFRQSHFVEGENNTREFYLGAKSIQLLQNTYSSDCGTFQALIEFPEINNSIVIHDTELVLNNKNQIILNTTQFEYYYYGTDEKPHKVMQTSPFTLQGHKLLIKFKIYNEYATPNIAMIKVNYKVI